MSQVNRSITDTKIQVEQIYKAQSDAFGLFDYPFLLDIINKNHSSKILDTGLRRVTLIGLAQRTKDIKFDAIDLNEISWKSANQTAGFQGSRLIFNMQI